ncbi:sensor histidine kinase [Aneurinibacillus uraniidurans]|uniref:sensor histidine kinase n=1 Tax=Aneurinibacillus uraniidurans TaxID=2966586 RepID=UPI0023491AF7|nr:sensor histidine kinase [Aneurinibacillus sp. B1]WCN37676.1 sensor histidine kinase [Aneurinibacillus sp. B1]
MKRVYLFTIMILLCMVFVLLTGCTPVSQSNQPTASKGVLDLQAWNFAQDGAVKLNGEWAFYWQELRESPPSPTASRHFLTLPHVWNGYEWNGTKLPAEGYATFMLTVRLNPREKNRLQAIYMPIASTAYRLIVNGKQLSTNGIVGTTKETMKPQYLPRLVYLQPETDTLHIVLQISNFMHKNGGIWKEIQLGDAQQLANWKEGTIIKQSFFIATFLVFGLYHLAIYIPRRRDVYSLYFGIFCFLISVRAALQDNISLIQMFPNFNWELALKFEYEAIFIGLPTFLMLIQSLYPQDINQKFVRIVQVISLCFVFVTAVTPAIIYTQLITAYYLVMLIVISYIMYALILTVVRKRAFSITNCLAANFFLITAIGDILYYNQIIRYGNFTSFGLFVFTLVQFTNLSVGYARNYRDVEQLSDELKDLNNTLEQRVQERTKSLEHSIRETAKARAEMSALEERNRIAGDIHDIVGHTLTTTIVQIEAGKRLVEKDLSRALEKFELSQDLVRNGLNEIRRAIRIEHEDEQSFIFPDALHHLIAETIKYTGVTIDASISPLPSLTKAQKKFIYHALQEGLTNGIRHGQSTHFIFLLERRNTALHFVLKDNGVGSSAITCGFGLTMMQKRARQLKGDVTLSSQSGKGYTISITMPIIQMGKESLL